MRSPLKFGWMIAVAMIVALAPQVASAQGFMVRPMTMQVNPLPSQTLEIPLKINNTAIEGARTVELRVVDLSQDNQGVWRLVEPDSSVSMTGHQSSLAWTTLSTDRVDIPPNEPATITVKLKPPANARGAYFAGIVAETPLPANPVGIQVRTRFLIPLIIQIRGRTVREHVALSAVSMTYKTDTGTPPTTFADISMTNSGQTFSKVRGDVTVERQLNDKWRVVTHVPFNERGIIPGVTLDLGANLERRLPSGPYRLRANLFVDGRRVPPLEKIIQFKGDANATVAYDATLLLQPSLVDMKVVPGATRTTVLHIQNTSANPVHIEMSSTTPRTLLGVQMGQLLGIKLSAQPWTIIQPAAFTLRANGRQSVRVMSSVPKSAGDYANYYADMVLKGTYPDGQSAGETFSTVRLTNIDIKSTPEGNIEELALAEGDDAKFIAQLRFANTGNVDLQPSVSLSLHSSDGGTVATATLSGGDEGPLLPLGKRMFSGTLDLSNIKPGDYSVDVLVSLDKDKQITRKYLASVKAPASTGDQAGIPIVTLTDAAATGSGTALNLTPDKSVALDPPSSSK